MVHLLVFELMTLLHDWLHLHHLSCHLLQLFDTNETRVDKQTTKKELAFKSSMGVSIQRCLHFHNTGQERAQGTTLQQRSNVVPASLLRLKSKVPRLVRGTVVVVLCTHSLHY